MAHGCILRRKGFLYEYLTSFSHFFPCRWNSRHALASQYLYSCDYYPVEGILCVDYSYQPNRLQRFLVMKGLHNVHRSVYSSPSGSHVTSFGFVPGGSYLWSPPVRMRSMSYRTHCISKATSNQQALNGNYQGHGDLTAKRRKETSPEECDQAIAGLNSAKAKAKTKPLQDSQKAANSTSHTISNAVSNFSDGVRVVASMSRKDWARKLVHWKHEILTTLRHYRLGARLLWVDTKISSRLLLKLSCGKGLSRRERQQLIHTTADIFRLVPFAVFVIVPFMEFLLPVFLRLFPNMLPSTFQDKMKDQESLKRRVKARIEYAKFLQDTIKAMTKEVDKSQSEETKNKTKDLGAFLKKVRSGEDVSDDETLAFAKLFNDGLIIGNISRPRLVNMCRRMGICSMGTDTYMRYLLCKRLQRIKEDDKLIQAEGIESCSEADLREDCKKRGMLEHLSPEEMRHQLRDWLDLSLNHSIPSLLLVLSRPSSICGKPKLVEAVKAALLSLPDEVVGIVDARSLSSEDFLLEKQRRLKYLEIQEELIKNETKLLEEEQSRIKDSNVSKKYEYSNAMAIPMAREAQKEAKVRTLEKHDHLYKLSLALAVLASASPVSREWQEFLQLVDKEAYRAAREKNDGQDNKAGYDKISSVFINKVDSLLQKLEQELDDVDAVIGDRWQLLDRDHDGKVTPEEMAAAAAHLKTALGEDGVQNLLSNLSKDRDGKILVDDIVKMASIPADSGNATEDCRV